EERLQGLERVEAVKPGVDAQRGAPEPGPGAGAWVSVPSHQVASPSAGLGRVPPARRAARPGPREGPARHAPGTRPAAAAVPASPGSAAPAPGAARRRHGV